MSARRYQRWADSGFSLWAWRTGSAADHRMAAALCNSGGRMTESIGTWHIVISGFLQTEGRMTGMLSLWRRLALAHSGPNTAVEIRSWDTNWRDLAELIWQFRPAAKGPKVYIYAYSWGAGYGFLQLAAELSYRGIRVVHALLSDPVYRSRYWLSHWISLLRWPTIRVPRNVDEVTWWYQRQNRPWGHAPVAAHARTIIHDGMEVDRIHQYMDDLEPFHDAAMALAAVNSVVPSPPPPELLLPNLLPKEVLPKCIPPLP